MATATIEATTIDKPSWRVLLEQEVAGIEVDESELREVLWESGVSKADYDRLLRTARERFSSHVELLAGRNAQATLSKLREQRQTVEAEAEAIRAKAQAAYEKQLAKAAELVDAFDAEHADELKQAERQHRRSLAASQTLARTADPGIEQRVEQLSLGKVKQLQEAKHAAAKRRDRGPKARQRLAEVEQKIATHSLQPLVRDGLDEKAAQLRNEIQAADDAVGEIAKLNGELDECQEQIKQLRESKLDWANF